VKYISYFKKKEENKLKWLKNKVLKKMDGSDICKVLSNKETRPVNTTKREACDEESIR
jgi:hypothetical protein